MEQLIKDIKCYADRIEGLKVALANKDAIEWRLVGYVEGDYDPHHSFDLNSEYVGHFLTTCLDVNKRQLSQLSDELKRICNA